MIAEFTPDRLTDEQYSVLYDFSEDSDVLLVIFSGVGLGFGIPYFEFLRTVEELPVKKIFVRDTNKAWYHAGIKGLGDTIDDSLPGLQDLIEKSKTSQVIMLGNSMGGYAAILYGVLLNAGHVIAFAPTTFANWSNRMRYWDHRKIFKYLRFAPKKSKQYFDLLRLPNIDKPWIRLVFDTDYRQDRKHAEHLGSQLKNVELHRFHGGKHKMIKNLKKSGKLEELIKEVVNEAVGMV